MIMKHDVFSIAEDGASSEVQQLDKQNATSLKEKRAKANRRERERYLAGFDVPKIAANANGINITCFDSNW